MSNLEKTIANRKLQDVILEVLVPLEDVEEIKDGVLKTSQKKMFPGYVLVHMVHTDDTWYVVRNTRGATGFVGPGGDLVALEPEELAHMGIGSLEEPKKVVHIDLNVGDVVTVTADPYKGTTGPITAINESKQRVTISTIMFGRETPLELSFSEVRKMN